MTAEIEQYNIVDDYEKWGIIMIQSCHAGDYSKTKPTQTKTFPNK